MALDKTQLFKVGGAAPAMFIYLSTDAVATVVASGYFNDATNELQKNDVIIFVDTDTGTVDLLAVTSATGATTVTTVNGT